MTKGEVRHIGPGESAAGDALRGRQAADGAAPQSPRWGRVVKGGLIGLLVGLGVVLTVFLVVRINHNYGWPWATGYVFVMLSALLGALPNETKGGKKK